jgi:outer membrane protein assembly factor BamE (lipoprotein component of BamABCDE complex)
VQAVSQVLTEANFAAVRPGQNRDELRWQLGRPSEQHAIWRGEMLWQYRYDTNNCYWFVVTVEPDGVVRDSGYVNDPICPDATERSTN